MRAKNFAVNEYVTSDEIKKIRKKLHLTQKEFAQLVGSSKPTIERWEKENAQIRGPIVLLIEMLNHDMDYVVSLEIPPKELPIRMWYMYKNKPCTLIDVDEAKKIVRIKNYVDNVQFTVFGSNTEPSIADYEDFLESRCLPRSRDKIKLELKESDIPFYDPYLIVKKRRGEWQKEYNQMTIRRANENDIPRLLELLEQVLQIHADIRPDIFIPGTTKYTNEELAQMIKDDTRPIYVAADENDNCLGYAFCQLQEQPFSNNMVPFTSLFIDDTQIIDKKRGKRHHIV